MRSLILVVLGLATLTGLVYLHLEARRRRELVLLTAVLDIVIGGLTAVAALSNATFTAWMQEDSWAEWATVYAFVIASVVILRRLWGWRKTAEFKGWLPRLGLLSVAAFCIFVAGEEISWGQRLLAFKPPEVFLQENFQQELNVHNMLKDQTLLGFSLDSRFLVAVIAVVYGGVVPGLRALQWRKLGWLQPTLDAVAPPWELGGWFGAVAFVELAYPIDLAGEACELVLGMLFATAALMHRHGRGEVPSALSGRGFALRLVLPLLLGIVTQPLVMLLVYGADDELVAQTEQELDMLRADLTHNDVIRPKLRRKRRVHKRLYTAVQSGYFEPRGGAYLEGRDTPALEDPDDPRRDRKGYFLDPWNNPYWVLVTRKGRRGILYSFGPNRRRDTRMPKKKVPEGFEAAGDDIIVGFSVKSAE